MAQLTITLLGNFGVARDRVPVTQFGADTARLLLAYLAMHAGDSFDREILADLLWPDQPKSEALHALRQALNRARNAIGDRETELPFLRITRDTIQFNPDSDYWLDVSAFTSLIAATRQHSHRRLEACRSCIHQLEQAAELYRGDLLPGFFAASHPFEEWLVMEREHLHRQALEVFYQLATHHERYEKYEQARKYAWRQVELEAWREEAHRQLMRALALSGQRSAAIAQYQRCCQTLADEMGVEPAQETTALYEQIQAGKLESLKAQPHNLPVQLTPFVGRESELAQVTELLNLPACRLLTVVGAGGIGKTRLALRVAEEASRTFKDGVCFAPLSAIDSPDLFITALAHSLQISLTGQEDPLAQISNYVREKELLLVLDSFEHLLAATEQVTHLLQRAPNLTLLITSRERLYVQSEWLYEVKGLKCPGDETPQAFDSDAVQLFAQSACRVCPDFLASANPQAVGQICRLVEGMPLAIELAASWTRALSCPEIVQEIERDVGFLKTSLQDVAERHRSLRAVLDSSWVLLSEEESDAMCRLSVFQGSFDKAAAGAVAAAAPSTLAALADKSLLHPELSPRYAPKAEPSQEYRYRLHNLVRWYAAQKLDQAPDLKAATQEQHCNYYASLLQERETDLQYAAQRQALAALDVDLENIRVAWKWAVAHAHTDKINQALEGLFLFYHLRGWLHEGEKAFGSAVETMRQHSESARKFDVIICKLLARQAASLFYLGRYDEAQGKMQTSLQGSRQSGDLGEMAFCLVILAGITIRQGEHLKAREYAEQALVQAQAAHLRHLEAGSLRNLGTAFFYTGDYAAAKRHYERALSIRQQLGDYLGEVEEQGNLGLVMYDQEDFETARVYYEQALQINRREIGNRAQEGWLLNCLGMLAADCGDYANADAYYKQALQISQAVGNRWGESNALGNLGVVRWALGDWSGAADYYERATQIKREIGDRHGENLIVGYQSLLFHYMGDDETAATYNQQSLSLAGELGDRRSQGYTLTFLGHILANQGQLAQAADAYRQAATLRRELGQHKLALEDMAGLAHVALLQGDLAQAQALVDEILVHLDAKIVQALQEPIRLYLVCYRVLRANRNPRAEEILRDAYEILQERASKIGDKGLRRSFLENVNTHREIIDEYKKLNLQ